MTILERDGFHVPPWPVLLAALMVPVFLALALWQVDRARGKEAAQALHDARAAAPAVAMPGAAADTESLRLRRVVALGRYEPDRQFLLDNRVFRGQAGYHVITPLRLEGSGMRLLVNRGWIAAGNDRRRLPETPAPTGRVSIEGIAVVPGPTFRLAPPDAGWQPVWQDLDLARYQALTGARLQPVVLELAPGSAGGFAREWSRPASGAARHFSYAAQWFVCALAAAGLGLRQALNNTVRTPAP